MQSGTIHSMLRSGGATALRADNDMAILRRELDHLAEIDGALARIKDGSYGTCQKCGEAIAPGRLEAQPTARHCVACQAKIESRAAPLHA